MAREGTPIVYLVSDSSAGFAWRASRAMMKRFADKVSVDEKLYPLIGVGRERDLARIAADAEKDGALIIYTFADLGMCETMRHEAAKRGVPAYDPLSPMVPLFESWLEATASHVAVHDEDPNVSRALEFSRLCSDGAHPELYGDAEVLLAGLSRSKKTPTLHELADRGIMAADLPLLPGIPIPDQVRHIPNGRIFVLTIDADRLIERRRSRLKIEGVTSKHGNGDYSNPAKVAEEFQLLEKFIKRHRGCHVIDVTHMASEEVAASILHRMGSSRR